MSSRDSILKTIRNQVVQSVPLPDLDQEWIEYDNPVQQFSEVLQSVGGRCHVVQSTAQIQEILKENTVYTEAKKCVSTFSDISGNVDLNSVDDPHELEDVDYAVLAGEFAVAENGAVWVTDHEVKHRVIYFIPQHLAFVVKCPSDAASGVVHNMYQAYKQLEVGHQPEFGVFISGPSKTADIEQSLVIGAHGARSLNVFLLEQ